VKIWPSSVCLGSDDLLLLRQPLIIVRNQPSVLKTSRLTKYSNYD
jgi:hypothetical protein